MPAFLFNDSQTKIQIVDLDKNAVLNEVNAAVFLGGLNPGTLSNWRAAGKGPIATKIGARRIGYKVQDLIDYVNAGRMAPGGGQR